MKKLLIPLVLLILILGLCILGFLWWNKNSQKVSDDTRQVDFLVVKGRSASQIGESLYQENLIKDPLAFKIYVQVSGKTAKFQSGQFRISPSYSLLEVVDTLMRPPAELWVTIPEGLRREEVIERFIKALEIKEAEAEAFREEFLSESESLEGFLFPDTYLFPRTVSAKTVVSRMRSTFDLKMKVLEKDLEASEFTLDEIVILASIVERETRTDEERPVVAGILMNRLDIDMGLQADATVQYAVASGSCRAGEECNWWPILTKDDLSINSPYNTYRFRGLPPDPIANPGLSSIKAALIPEETDYLYYLHDSDGSIHYAETLAEHNENVRRYIGK
ncbi:hypothetical protein A2985_00840 [Candidatus Woesebacteria bacterium RIFCSPLOWO2_01_FULL_43_11]|uniref:Endolytic murein transglycosylase n=1 Tax=Candidatus Woesebacteria bacterium RBG_16_42_24 TaxID=1802485 RepID=A0A1F7XLL9_9BACT|nr:MAG: hypothetical protein A2V97_03955 [Candidatus Woesebacteria bacterium RBG_16_42_24]OGM68000.1 MAG: hypothetical protein A2985_00840 [Candidatus Woesebacteria bacterium RIFCSPLOWO2_01_FULL_43_11]